MTLRTLAIIGGALAFVLLMVLGWEMKWGRAIKKPFPEATTLAAKPLEVTLLPEYKLSALQARKETIERPLFVPTRRPAPVEDVIGVKPKSAMQKGLFVLSGTAIVGATRIAFLRNAKDNKPKTVRVGDDVEGMKVAVVSADRVRLVLGNEEEELLLKVMIGPKGAVTPPPKPAVAVPPIIPPLPAVAAEVEGVLPLATTPSVDIITAPNRPKPTAAPKRGSRESILMKRQSATDPK